MRPLHSHSVLIKFQMEQAREGAFALASSDFARSFCFVASPHSWKASTVCVIFPAEREAGKQIKVSAERETKADSFALTPGRKIPKTAGADGKPWAERFAKRRRAMICILYTVSRFQSMSCSYPLCKSTKFIHFVKVAKYETGCLTEF